MVEEQSSSLSSSMSSSSAAAATADAELLSMRKRAPTRKNAGLQQQQQRQGNASSSYCPYDEEWKDHTIDNKTTRPNALHSTNIQDKQRESLPIYRMKKELLEAMTNHPVLLVVGDTGSGKTTQIPQYLLELRGVGKKGIIGCIQPRRAGAVSAARRVAQEYGCCSSDAAAVGGEVQHVVGYSIRSHDNTSPFTRIQYMTDKVLVREYQADKILGRYAALLLDQAQERSTVRTNAMVALFQDVCRRRPDMKIIVATSDGWTAERLSTQFFQCPIFSIPKKQTFPVEIFYTKKQQEPTTHDLDAVVATVLQIHRNEPAGGDILVCLSTGKADGDTFCHMLRTRLQETVGDLLLTAAAPPPPAELVILAVHTFVPWQLAPHILEPAPRGARKCIVATHRHAELSLVLHGISYVVDPGITKPPHRTSDSRVVVAAAAAAATTTTTALISQTSARRRASHAGHTGPGKCFRLYTEQTYNHEMLVVEQNNNLLQQQSDVNDSSDDESDDDDSVGDELEFDAAAGVDNDGVWTRTRRITTTTTRRPSLTLSSSSSLSRSSSCMTVDEAVEQIGFGPFQCGILIASGLCFAADAMQIVLLSFLTVVLQHEWMLTKNETAFITSVLFAGSMAGTLSLGPLADVYGRRPVFLFAAAWISAFGLAASQVRAYWQLLVCMFAGVGFGIGGLTVPFDILAEFLPSRRRGTFLLLIEYFWTLGCLLVVCLAYLTLHNHRGDHDDKDQDRHWRWFVALCSIPCLISLLAGYFVVPESARWLVSQGRTQEALAILKHAAACNGRHLCATDGGPILRLQETSTIAAARADHDHPQEQQASFLDLLQPKWRKITLLLWGMWGAMSFGYYGTILSITKVFSSEDSHEPDSEPPWNTTTANETMQSASSSSYDFDYSAIFVSSSAELVGVTLVILMVDRVGRIPSQVVSYALAGISVCMLNFLASTTRPSGATSNATATAVHRLWLVAFGFSARVFEMAGTCVSWVSTAEILSTEVRSTGHAAANAVARMGAFVAPFVVQGGSSHRGGNEEDASSSLRHIGFVMLLVHLVTVLCAAQLPETKGRSMGVSDRFDTDEAGGDHHLVPSDDLDGDVPAPLPFTLVEPSGDRLSHRKSGHEIP